MSKLGWDRDGLHWPNREHSRFVQIAGLRWHVQMAGTGPALVLLHGTGASTHSWRDILPVLSERFTVVAPDLPGHGFTAGRVTGGPTLPRIAGAIGELLRSLGVEPALLAGHSAGSAIALELARGSAIPVVGFSPALMPFPGLAARLFPAMAKMLFVNPFVPSIFARMARGNGEIERFLWRATRSRIDATGLRFYGTLLGNSEHCAGALAMMANWDLEALKARLPAIDGPVLLAHGTKDPAVPLDSVRQACTLLRHCHLELLDGAGHLAHEEQPQRAAEMLFAFAAKHAEHVIEGS